MPRYPRIPRQPTRFQDPDPADGEGAREVTPVEAQREVMLGVFRQAGLTRANFAAEVAAVARAAAAEGEYAPAGKLYELVGRSIGVLGGESHVHLHTSDPAILAQRERLAALTDEQLIELAEGRRTQDADVVSVSRVDDGADIFR